MRGVSRFIVGVFVCLISTAALGGGPASHAASAPRDVDVFLTLEGATLSDWSFLTDVAGAGAAGERAWRELGVVLRMDESETFERLVGRRASIVARGVWEGDAEWVALLSTDGGAAKRFQKAFKATPRRIVGGRPVLALEGGRFQAAVLPSEHGVVLALSPLEDGSGSLFEALCGGATESLATTERFKAIEKLGDAKRYAAAVTLPEGKGWLVGGAGSLGAEIEIELLGRIAEPCEALAAFDPSAWSEAMDGAAFGVVERAGSLFGAGDEGALGPLAVMGPMFEAMGEGAGEVAAMTLRLDEDGGAAIGAAATMSPLAGRAEGLDRAASGTVASMRAALGQPGLEQDFLGLYPEALRRAKLKEGLEVLWAYAPGRRGEGAAELDWFVGGNDERAVRALVEAAESPGAATEGGALTGSWRSVGHAMPMRLIAWLGAKGGDAPEPLRGLAKVEEIRWGVRDLPGGRVEGTIRVRRSAPGEDSH
jgi:hypothetical protein